MWVMACSKISGRGLERATEPLSPTTNTLQAFLSALTMALISLTMLELVPPHKPLSEVTGTRRVFLTVTGCFFFCKQVSLQMILSIEPTPKNLAFSRRPTSCFILDAATIFIALVIFLIDSTAFIRILISFKLFVAKVKLLLKRRGEQDWTLLRSIYKKIKLSKNKETLSQASIQTQIKKQKIFWDTKLIKGVIFEYR